MVKNMIITVTEIQKQEIESHGYMVSEFKLWAKKINVIIMDASNAIMLFLQDTMRKIIKCLENLQNAFDKISKSSKKIFKCEKIHLSKEPMKYKIIRSIGNIRELNFNKRVIYHRCRDRC